MASFNKITIIGYLGRDPVIRYTPQGTAVCDFSIATTERRGGGADSQEITTWFKITLWGRQAETASQYLVKGKAVYIEGRLRIEEYTDREGKPRQSLEVNATDMQFIGSRGEEGLGATAGGGGGYDERPAAPPRPAAGPAPRQDYPAPEPDISDDDIPF